MADPAPYAEPGPDRIRCPRREPTTPPLGVRHRPGGRQLTGDRGTWDPTVPHPSLSSVWLRCNDAAMTCETTGDTDTTYAVGPARTSG